MPKPLSEKQMNKLVWEAVRNETGIIELPEGTEFYFTKKKHLAHEGDKLYNQTIKLIKE